MSNRTREEINKSEKEIWDGNTLQRTKIRQLRRHSFRYSDRRQKKKINEILNTFNGKNILEIGSYAWTEWFSEDIRPNKLTCINISETSLESGKILAKRKKVPFDIEFHLMDANNLTFPDESFDLVYGGAILHHLDIDKTMEHIHRVLKPGGSIMFTEPLNMNPAYKLYRLLNKKERTPDEHALVYKDFKTINSKFTFKHDFYDLFTVFTGVISNKLFGDKNFNNWINKLGYNLDLFFSKIPLVNYWFARVLVYGNKK